MSRTGSPVPITVGLFNCLRSFGCAFESLNFSKAKCPRMACSEIPRKRMNGRESALQGRGPLIGVTTGPRDIFSARGVATCPPRRFCPADISSHCDLHLMLGRHAGRHIGLEFSIMQNDKQHGFQRVGGDLRGTGRGSANADHSQRGDRRRSRGVPRGARRVLAVSHVSARSCLRAGTRCVAAPGPRRVAATAAGNIAPGALCRRDGRFSCSRSRAAHASGGAARVVAANGR